MSEQGQDARNAYAPFKAWRIFLPETIILIALVLAAGALFSAGGRFEEIHPHPFWVVVLLISVQYGAGAGLLAACLCAIALYAGALPVRAPGVDFYTYSAAIAGRPMAWIAAAIVFGGLRSMHLTRASVLEADRQKSEYQAATLAGGLDRALAEIQRLEERIASDTASSAATLEKAAMLSEADAASFFDVAGQLATEILGAKDYSILVRNGNGLIPVGRAGGGSREGAAALIDSQSSTFAALATGKTLAHGSAEDRHLLPPGALFVTPLYARRGGQVLGALLVDELAARQTAEAYLAQANGYSRLVGSLADKLKIAERGGLRLAAARSD